MATRAEVHPFLQITEGKAVSGVVANVAEFGLFVSLARGLDGVLLFDSTPCAEIARRLRVGDTLEVFVRSVDVEREQVCVELLPDPTRYERFWSQTSAKQADA